jgi:uncharacterized membrane protein
VLTARDEGSVMLLVIGYTAIAALLIVVGIDVSKVFLAQRALSSAADAAALAASQEVDRAALYAGEGRCTSLPVDADAARRAVEASVADAAAGLRATFVALAPPEVDSAGGIVHVQLHGEVVVPFGRVVEVLLPGHPGGRIGVAAGASAASSVVGGGC